MEEVLFEADEGPRHGIVKDFTEKVLGLGAGSPFVEEGVEADGVRELEAAGGIATIVVLVPVPLVQVNLLPSLGPEPNQTRVHASRPIVRCNRTPRTRHILKPAIFKTLSSHSTFHAISHYHYHYNFFSPIV